MDQPRRESWHDGRVDALDRYLAASSANDIDGLMDTLAPGAEVFSPISGRMVFRGHDDLRVLLGAVYGSLNNLRWGDAIGDGSVRVVVGEAAIGPVRMGDAMVFELAEDGRIKTIRPHLRPWLALTLFAITLAPKVGRHPGLLGRALRG